MSDLELDIIFPGKPIPQGSMTLMTSRSTGRPFGKYNSNVINHRNALVVQLKEEWGGRVFLTEAVELDVTFRFKRPQSHYRTGKFAGLLKNFVPIYHVQTPDLDKLVRLVGDALTTAGVLKDDKLICRLVAEKAWEDTNIAAGTHIRLFSIRAS